MIKREYKETPILSICIPTYNRPKELIESLQSIMESVKGYESKVEIIVSNDAGPANTEEIIGKMKNDKIVIQHHRNTNNMRDANFFVLANLARGKYLWVFGDDDLMEKHTVRAVLEKIKDNYNLVICNYSLWSNDFSKVIRDRVLPIHQDVVISEHDTLLKTSGLRLGFISMIIIRRDIFLALPPSEYEAHIEYGFSFLYAVYSGVLQRCRAYICSQPILKQRGASFDAYANKEWWYKCFVVGSSFIFEELRKKGYSIASVKRAKYLVLKDDVMHDLSFRRRNGEDVSGLFKLMLTYYKDQWFFWVVCVPLLFMPRIFIKIANNLLGMHH